MKPSVLQGVHFICQLSGYTSLTSAAKALNLTIGAVSQQLQKSEQDLGFTVFERHARGIRLNDEGKQLVKITQPYFASIEDCVSKLSQRSERQEVYLKLTPSFAFKWLVPRLEVFHRMHSDIQIHTFAEGAIVDSESRDFDLAIDYGKILYQKMNAELLMKETLTVVMSAEYFAKHNFGGKDWKGVTLLHDAMPWHDAEKDYEWSYWAKKNHLMLGYYKWALFQSNRYGDVCG
jgi:DNA-binding transcriptional LysR family regulator